jgi:uncharacterized protein YbjT (DUF2867 family)
VLARGEGVDLLTGIGLDAAVEGIDVVVDVSNVTTSRKSAAVRFFDTVSRRLMSAADRAGVEHYVALSIVGVDRVRFPYYAGKLRQESIVRRGPVPWTILRSTQFHDFAAQVLNDISGPLAVVPTARVQPIAAREVAEALANIAIGRAQGMAPEIAGPRVESLVEMAKALMAAGGARRRPVLPLYVPGGMSNGNLLPANPGPRGIQTFADWLAATYRRR